MTSAERIHLLGYVDFDPRNSGLIPSARGKGYASEALRGLLLFERARGVTCVKGDADHDNIASQHVTMAVGVLPSGHDERVRYFEITWTDTTANTDPRS